MGQKWNAARQFGSCDAEDLVLPPSKSHLASSLQYPLCPLFLKFKRKYRMKQSILYFLVCLFSSLSGAMTITNQTQETVWCSVYCMKDKLPVESMTRGWWELAHGGSAIIGNKGTFVCNGYFCKNSSNKHWSEKKSGVQINACVDEKSSPFEILSADQPAQCRRLGATTVTFGLVNTDTKIRLVP